MKDGQAELLFTALVAGEGAETTKFNQSENYRSWHLHPNIITLSDPK